MALNNQNFDEDSDILDTLFGDEEDIDADDGYESDFDDVFNSLGDMEVGMHESGESL